MEQNFCICPTAKTQKYVEDDNNKCSTCKLMLIEKCDDVASLLRHITLGNLPGASRNVNAQGVRLKPPTFNGKGDSKHFFVKLANYMETY